MSLGAVHQAPTKALAKPTIPAWFVEALTGYLASWRQEITADVARAYWDTLSDLEPADVLDAGLELRRSAGGEWPPSASTWHQAAITRNRERRLRDAIVLGRDKPWKSECRDCDDTGFELFTCTAAVRCGRPVCARADESHEHTFAAVCPCRATNRTYMRSRERERSNRPSVTGKRERGI